MNPSIQIGFVCVALVVAGIWSAEGSVCLNESVDDPASSIALTWNFGIQDSGNGTAIYAGSVWSEGNTKTSRVENALMANYFNYWINGVPVVRGKNYTVKDSSLFVPTANFTCLSDYSGIWGPAFADFRDVNTKIRGRYQNLEVYVHYSAPNETSYIRSILYVKNTGSSVERVRITGDWYSNYYGVDWSPISDEGRYYTMFPFQEGDLGSNGNGDVVSNFNNYIESFHVRGPKARDPNVLVANLFTWNVLSPNYYTELEAGDQLALMFIFSVGTNRTVALKNAAFVDSEPAQIFHDLNADQLSLIRNWGGCEVILSPEVSVTVNPPSQCSNGATNDFNVNVNTARTDFTNGFSHRIVSDWDNELVAAQSSSTIAVPNGAGSVKHQLWYRDCLLKETSFVACNATENQTPTPNPNPSNAPSKSPQTKVSGSPSNVNNFVTLAVVTILGMFASKNHQSGIVLLIAMALTTMNVSDAQTCSSTDVGDFTAPIQWSFGLKDGAGTPVYAGDVLYGAWSSYDLYAETNSIYSSFYNYWINSVPVLGGKNHDFNNPSSFVPTSKFTCDSDYSGLWGPAYPDYRNEDLAQRARFPNIETYIHLSAPNQTSYIRSILFIKNTGNTAERVHINTDSGVTAYSADISPLGNGGRYYTMFPFQDGDMGTNNDDPASKFATAIASLHAAGPRGREAKSSQVVAELGLDKVSPLYYTTLAAGQQFAVMFVVSFGVNRTLALANAAEIDTEPAYLFHNLNADQLSLIRNWGGCEVVLGPEVSVTVNPPSKCSNGATNDFNVNVNTARTDFTTGFMHRVVSSKGKQIVAAQASSTVSVPNGVGSVKHQLWYKECLVKETSFKAC